MCYPQTCVNVAPSGAGSLSSDGGAGSTRMKPLRSICRATDRLRRPAPSWPAGAPQASGGHRVAELEAEVAALHAELAELRAGK